MPYKSCISGLIDLISGSNLCKGLAAVPPWFLAYCRKPGAGLYVAIQDRFLCCKKDALWQEPAYTQSTNIRFIIHESRS